MTRYFGIEIPRHLDDGRFEGCEAKHIKLWLKFDRMSEDKLVEHSKNNPSTGVPLTEDDLAFHTVDDQGFEGQVCRNEFGEIYFHRWVDELDNAAHWIKRISKEKRDNING